MVRSIKGDDIVWKCRCQYIVVGQYNALEGSGIKVMIRIPMPVPMPIMLVLMPVNYGSFHSRREFRELVTTCRI